MASGLVETMDWLREIYLDDYLDSLSENGSEISREISRVHWMASTKGFDSVELRLTEKAMEHVKSKGALLDNVLEI